MPIDRTGDPWSGTPYSGSSSGPAAQPGSPRASRAAPRRRPSTRALMIGGVTGALTLGVLFGLWARPELVGSKPTPAVEQPLTATDLASSGAAPQVPIALNPPAAETPPRAPGRLQTLPPAMAAAARMRAESTSRRPAAPQAPGPPTSLIAPTPPEAAETPPSPQFHTSFDCATARPGAEEMVCEDPALAAADRQMARAYRRATHSGIDLGDLSQEQRDWMAIREDAARHSPHALAQIYDQRIDELNRIADGGPMAGR